MRIVCPNPNRNKSIPRIGPVSFTQTKSIPHFPTIAERNLDTYHELWSELHSEQHATPEWFAAWVKRVPKSDCGCAKWLAVYLQTNQPRYEDWYLWTVELHNSVNVKLQKPIWTP